MQDKKKRVSLMLPIDDITVINKIRGEYIAKTGKSLSFQQVAWACIRIGLKNRKEVLRIAVDNSS